MCLLIRNLTRENLIDCVNFWCQLKNDREFIFRSFHIVKSIIGKINQVLSESYKLNARGAFVTEKLCETGISCRGNILLWIFLMTNYKDIDTNLN